MLQVNNGFPSPRKIILYAVMIVCNEVLLFIFNHKELFLGLIVALLHSQEQKTQLDVISYSAVLFVFQSIML